MNFLNNLLKWFIISNLTQFLLENDIAFEIIFLRPCSIYISEINLINILLITYKRNCIRMKELNDD